MSSCSISTGLFADPPPSRTDRDRQAALVVHRLCGLADAVCRNDDAGRAAVALLGTIIAYARKPGVTLNFEEWRVCLNAIHAAFTLFPRRFPVSDRAQFLAYLMVDTVLRHRGDGEWVDFHERDRRATLEPIERLRSRIRTFATQRYFEAYEGRNAA